MPRCAEQACGRWRPDLSSMSRLTGMSLRSLSAVQFNKQWYCSRGCVERAARAGLTEKSAGARLVPGLPPLKLGVVLRHAGAITQAQLDKALAATEGTGLRLGEQLEQLGFAGSNEVLRALAKQAGVSYLSTFDISRVEKGCVSLPAATVRALGLVPFEFDEARRRVSVVCAAPLPRAAMRALVRLTGWTPRVYFVTDRVFEAALEAYRPAEGTPQAVSMDSLAAVAAHVADMAAQERAVTMQFADWNAGRWVRVQAPEGVSDLFFGGAEEERGCQAELIAH